MERKKGGTNKSRINNFLYKKESYEIIDTAKEVWRELGGAFKEKIVDKAYTIALEKRNLTVENQKRINVYFDNKKIGTYVPDKIVNNIIIIEVKCKECLMGQDTKQLWHYLKVTDYKLGFIINFSPRGVQFKRIVYDTARSKQ